MARWNFRAYKYTNMRNIFARQWNATFPLINRPNARHCRATLPRYEVRTEIHVRHTCTCMCICVKNVSKHHQVLQNSILVAFRNKVECLCCQFIDWVWGINTFWDGVYRFNFFKVFKRPAWLLLNLHEIEPSKFVPSIR